MTAEPEIHSGSVPIYRYTDSAKPEIQQSEDDASPSEPDTQQNDETPSLEPITHKHHVKMQRLAKKRRLFLVQKLTRRIKVLKGKKGTEQQVSKNQRKVDRFVSKLDDMKQLNLEILIAELVTDNFTRPKDPESSTSCWFKSELLEDRFSFMAYVNPLLGKEVERKPRPQPKRERPKMEVADQIKKPYKEEEDEVLQDILTTKKNRPGQRARQKQAEEKYGEKAKHLTLSKPQQKQQGKSGGKGNQVGGKRKQDAPPSAQEIMKRLKAEEKIKRTEKSEHPSWLAKKQQASQSAQIDVFAGTKIIFDDDSD